jgi:hypothetical protein
VDIDLEKLQEVIRQVTGEYFVAHVSPDAGLSFTIDGDFTLDELKEIIEKVEQEYNKALSQK